MDVKSFKVEAVSCYETVIMKSELSQNKRIISATARHHVV
jgi:hypothetical protein